MEYEEMKRKGEMAEQSEYEERFMCLGSHGLWYRYPDQIKSS